MQQTIIITGGIDEGKTSFLKKIVAELEGEGKVLRGFLAPKVMENEIKTGYNLRDVSNNKEVTFIRFKKFPDSVVEFEKFYFSNAGTTWGNNILQSYVENPSGILIIDEVGPLEIADGRWTESLNKLVKLSNYNMIWVVRKQILNEVLKKWNLKNHVIIDISQAPFETAKEIILGLFSD